MKRFLLEKTHCIFVLLLVLLTLSNCGSNLKSKNPPKLLHILKHSSDDNLKVEAKLEIILRYASLEDRGLVEVIRTTKDRELLGYQYRELSNRLPNVSAENLKKTFGYLSAPMEGKVTRELKGRLNKS